MPNAITFDLPVFAALAVGVWICGVQLTRLADAIADRYDLARSIVGVVFLASATSLPELATTVAGSVKAKPELVLSNLFGGIVLQTAILAIADFWCRDAITNAPRKADHVLQAVLLISLLAVLQAAVIAGEPIVIGWIGAGAMASTVAYIGALWLLRRYDRTNDWVPVDLPDTPGAKQAAQTVKELTRTRLLAYASLVCAAILVLGTGLVWAADRLAESSGLGTGFVGVVFLAAATSLPELSTTIAAVRMRAHTLAISNVFGSNLIMVAFVFPADVLTTDGPILRVMTPTVSLALTLGIVVTAIALIGLLVRRKVSLGRIGLDSAAILLVYAGSLWLFWSLA